MLKIKASQLHPVRNNTIKDFLLGPTTSFVISYKLNIIYWHVPLECLINITVKFIMGILKSTHLS